MLGKTKLSSSLFERWVIFLALGEMPNLFGRAYLVHPKPSHGEETRIEEAGLRSVKPEAAGGDLSHEDAFARGPSAHGHSPPVGSAPHLTALP